MNSQYLAGPSTAAYAAAGNGSVAGMPSSGVDLDPSYSGQFSGSIPYQQLPLPPASQQQSSHHASQIHTFYNPATESGPVPSTGSAYLQSNASAQIPYSSSTSFSAPSHHTQELSTAHSIWQSGMSSVPPQQDPGYTQPSMASYALGVSSMSPSASSSSLQQPPINPTASGSGRAGEWWSSGSGRTAAKFPPMQTEQHTGSTSTVSPRSSFQSYPAPAQNYSSFPFENSSAYAATPASQNLPSQQEPPQAFTPGTANPSAGATYSSLGATSFPPVSQSGSKGGLASSANSLPPLQYRPEWERSLDMRSGGAAAGPGAGLSGVNGGLGAYQAPGPTSQYPSNISLSNGISARSSPSMGPPMVGFRDNLPQSQNQLPTYSHEGSLPLAPLRHTSPSSRKRRKSSGPLPTVAQVESREDAPPNAPASASNGGGGDVPLASIEATLEYAAHAAYFPPINMENVHKTYEQLRSSLGALNSILPADPNVIIKVNDAHAATPTASISQQAQQSLKHLIDLSMQGFTLLHPAASLPDPVRKRSRLFTPPSSLKKTKSSETTSSRSSQPIPSARFTTNPDSEAPSDHSVLNTNGWTSKPPNVVPQTGPSTTPGSKDAAQPEVYGGVVCLGCGATDTPEWRRGPLGPRTLCNACGLVFAKLVRKRAREAAKAAAIAAGLPVPKSKRGKKAKILAEADAGPNANTGKNETGTAPMSQASSTRKKVKVKNDMN